MKPILRSQVLNPYRSNKPRGFYSVLRGHTGVDLNYKNEDLACPVTGKVVYAVHQKEMGNTMYIQDSLGNFHVFAHLTKFLKKPGDSVARNEIIALTGNSGAKTTSPHLHYEVITQKPVNFIDRIMKRNELVYKGFNTDPLLYLKNLYFKFNVDLDGNLITSI